MAPVLVPLRPSSEHILIVRAPGARDRHACHSIPFHRARSANKEGTWPLLPHPSDRWIPRRAGHVNRRFPKCWCRCILLKRFTHMHPNDYPSVRDEEAHHW